MTKIAIFDTTLRDGEQSPGATMTPSEKLRMAHQLAALGVDVIEAGFPISSIDDFNSVRTVAKEIREGRLTSWLIEAAEIKWELGLARLRGGHFSPIGKEFVRLCKESFVEREKELKAKR